MTEPLETPPFLKWTIRKQRKDGYPVWEVGQSEPVMVVSTEDMAVYLRKLNEIAEQKGMLMIVDLFAIQLKLSTDLARAVTWFWESNLPVEQREAHYEKMGEALTGSPAPLKPTRKKEAS